MSNIEWTNETWNCVTGCQYASEGCRFCYAASMSKRLAAMGQKKYQGIVGKGHFNGVVKTWDDELTRPLRWRKPKMIFVNSMSDTFHKGVPFEFIDKIFAAMALCPQHTFQVLTKRPERAADYLTSIGRHSLIDDAILNWHSDQEATGYRLSNRLMVHPLKVAENMRFRESWPLPNCWVGTSIEDQQRADERAEHLRRCPATLRFYSVEPLLGPIERLPLDGIHWCIVGGESGHGARQCNLAWIRSIIEQCRSAGVSCFVKQLGSVWANERVTQTCGQSRAFRYKHDLKGGNPSEWPRDLHAVRQFPTPTLQ